MRKKRHNYTPEEKVAILRRHLIDRVAISDLCDEYQLQPALFYEWQKVFFEKGAAAFARTQDSQKSAETVRIPPLPHDTMCISNHINWMYQREFFLGHLSGKGKATFYGALGDAF